MKIWKVATLAVIAFSVGWIGAEVRNAHKLLPGDVISNQWIEHVTLLTNAAGKPLAPTDVVQSVGFSLESYSTALGLHYDQLSKDQILKLAPYVALAKGVASRHELVATLRVVRCMEEAQSKGDVALSCHR